MVAWEAAPKSSGGGVLEASRPWTPAPEPPPDFRGGAGPPRGGGQPGGEMGTSVPEGRPSRGHCSKFRKQGKCDFGARCKYSHEAPSEEEALHERISRFMMMILRHRADEQNLELDLRGRARMNDLLAVEWFRKRGIDAATVR